LYYFASAVIFTVQEQGKMVLEEYIMQLSGRLYFRLRFGSIAAADKLNFRGDTERRRK
jgi:hypothetical protein